MGSIISNINQVSSDFRTIKEKIIEKGVTVPDGTPTSDYADKIDAVYNAGKNAVNRAWWDMIMATTNHEYRFRHTDWTNKEFDPPSVIRPSYSGEMFRNAKGIKKLTNQQIDFSNCVGVNYAFANSEIEELPIIDLTKSTTAVNYIFSNAVALHTIEKLILKADGSQTFTGAPFHNTNALQNIKIEGAIGSTISFQWCSLLTSASIESIVRALYDNATGQTLTFHSDVKTTYYNAHSEEYADADTAWKALCDTKSNWTISLI